jgi:hypothetical protein
MICRGCVRCRRENFRFIAAPATRCKTSRRCVSAPAPMPAITPVPIRASQNLAAAVCCRVVGIALSGCDGCINKGRSKTGHVAFCSTLTRNADDRDSGLRFGYTHLMPSASEPSAREDVIRESCLKASQWAENEDNVLASLLSLFTGRGL